jgi:hypothetical protein
MRATFVACLLLSPVLLAQDPPPKVVSGTLGLDITSQYFFRGLLQQNDGLILQPSLELGYGLYQADDDSSLRSLDLKFGLWNSLHNDSGSAALGVWYESDFFVELASRLGERLTTGVQYVAYQNPNRVTPTNPAFSQRNQPVEELVFTFDFNDRGMWLESIDGGLQPSLVLAFELDGQREVATVNGGHSGVYLGVGVEPSFVVGQIGDGDLTLTLPATLGLSLRDYYERTNGGGNDDFFGYLDVGAELSAPLKFLPARMGPWQGEVGLHLLLLGDNNRARNSGDTSELILSAGLSTYF